MPQTAAGMSVTSWFLVSSGGTRHRLPREMIFVGRDDCELMLQSRSVDKQHAVINYEAGTDEHKVKDLGSLNGTFVNDVRIQEQMYITLKLEDKLRFGYDTNLFTVVRGELTVPEEALKHEKFTSGLQISKKPPNPEPTPPITTNPHSTSTPIAKTKSPSRTPSKPAKTPGGGSLRQGESRPAEGVPSTTESGGRPSDSLKGEEKMTADMAALHRGTPLYGQPSWWGDGDADDENSFKQETKSISRKPEGCGSDSREARRGEKLRADGLQDPCGLDTLTKEGKMADNGIHEIPTKDTEGSNASAQGHASFTIEFDSTSPGKVTIKDHVARCTPDHPRSSRSKKSGAGSGGGGGGRDLSTLQVAMMASESKVADWLAQNDPTMVRRESTEEDSKSIKSDVPVNLSRLKGSKHEDGTQSDSENGVGLRFANRRHALEERLRAAHEKGGGGGASSGGGGGGGGSVGSSALSGGARTPGGRTSFMIEFIDEENPRKRRSYSFSQSAPLLPGGVGGEGLCPQPPSHPKVFSISTSATINSSGDSGKGPTPISATVTAGAPTAARALLKQRSEDLSIGRSSVSTGLQTGSPTTPSEDASALGRGEGTEGALPEDDHSDKGTYTIELENRNPEEEEARRMIDKVFGVDQNQNPESSISADLKGGGGKKIGDPGKEALIGDSSWVSQWASVAANQTRTDPEGSGAETPAFLHKEREASSKRRTLPLLPLDEARSKSATKAPGLRSEIGEKQDTELQEKESHMEHQGDGQSHTPMEEGGVEGKGKPSSAPSAPRNAPGSAERRKRSEERKGGGGGAEGGELKSGKPLLRQGSFTIEKPSANVPAELIPHINRGHERSDSTGSMDTATLLKDTEAVMAFLEAKLRDENKLDQKGAKSGSSAKASSAYHASRTGSISPESDVDTASTASQAAGEADRRALAAGALKQRRSLSSMHREKSNVSASSKAGAVSASARERLERKTKSRPSEATGRGDARRPAPPPASSRGRQPSLDLTDDDQTSFPISDILSSDQESYSAPGFGSYRRRGSHLSADDLLHPGAGASAKGSAKAGRSLQAATAASLGKQAALPTPRPTRASLLRRARLGDTSDTDLADADRVSVASEVSTTSSTSKPPSGRKGPSRLDMLAQPRRHRLGSISARSDSECTVGRGSISSSSRLSAETALRLGLRSSTPTESRLTPRMRANSVSKLTETKGKTQATSGYCSPTDSPQPDPEGGATDEAHMVSSSSRWRRLPPEYGSTSEEEFGSNRNTNPKHGGRAHLRPHHPVLHRGSASRLTSAGSNPTSTTAGGAGSGLVSSPGGVVMKHRMREQDEYIRDWTAHSEEIARISQDLAKDLAILAREIHDVAGEIDSVSSSGTAPSTTASTAATTPGSAIDTREEVGPARPAQPDVERSSRKLVDRVFDESLNFRKIPPVITPNKAPEINGKPVELRPRAPDTLEPRALRRRTWNREEAVLDSLLITSVTQLSSKIRQSVDKTAGKIRILFKDKERNWEEIESKLKSDTDIPHLKTANKEFSSILLELKRVEKQLQVIDVMVDPDGSLDALASLGLTSPTAATKPLAAKPPPPSSSTPSAGPHPPIPGSLPEIMPKPVVPSAPTKSQAVSGGPQHEPARGLSVVGAMGAGIGGPPYGRIRPSGEEAIAQK
ncbi:centrosomal protein of 170 kDa isoform X2 [Gadus macrocephalus]|uniref:centrosomal protein of 170 kDa isoform X2 n=1 Tax=Gadus macrocephalus TaxID=80720 RepID=UPI0028CB2D69|nr:centrosomal protein of 170 kDa isoform X2 [Gadus macrocephalus]